MTIRYVGDEEMAAVQQVVESQQLWRGLAGNFVLRFEGEFGKYVDRKYVYALNSGTSANEAALAGCGIEPGDEVICPPCSFIASSLSVVALGAVPVFADVDPRTLLITAEEIEKKITNRTRAVVVVHLFGQSAEMDSILDVARRHRLFVVEDCAQAYDAYYKGKMVGSLGHVACYSLQQSKHITCGEGGIVVTDDPEIYQRVVLYSNCGMPWYQYGLEAPKPANGTRGHFAFGHNYRMSELQGAVALAQLAKIGEFNARRQHLVRIIEEELRDVPGIELAHANPETRANYWAYPLRLNKEETGLTAREVSELCQKEGVAVGYYNEINYLEEVFQEMERRRHTSLGCPLPPYVRYRKGTCPNAEEAGSRLIPLNTHHGVTPEEVRRASKAIRAVIEGRAC
ncbi:MAG TPA: DegT/DnrJ/EryC1/StrS family aminotransferase [Candidatus Latescibacteria bacterium]|nr:DegT/DnrJ/EryC1/StrS family aminotransferase [Candidatus Latescibacterota bacterium]